MATLALFAELVDDAAVFPPGSAPIHRALTDHRCLRESAAAPYIGPLLVPVSVVPELLTLVGDPAEPLTIGVIGVPGAVDALIAAVDRVSVRTGLRVSGVEIAPSPATDIGTVIAGLAPLLERNLPVAIEVRRNGSDELAALAERRDLIDAGLLRGKYRTGGVQPGSVPSTSELAAVLDSAVRLRLPIKLTAGLHHAVRTDEQHGVLNVLAAVHAATTGSGAERWLGEADSAALVGELTSWSAQQIAAVRTIFTSFGCCGVLEPLTEAARVGLIPPLAYDLTAPMSHR